MSKLTALRKLTQAKHFILITEDEAIMQVDMNTTDINKTITLAQQRASLDSFKHKVNDAIKQFDRKLTKQTPRNKGKRIPVKQG